MSYTNNKKFRDSKDFKSRRGYQERFTEGQEGRKGPEGSGKRDTFISAIAMKSLPRSSYTVKVDPYTETFVNSRVYPFLAGFNGKQAPHYGGDDNLDGGTASQYMTALETKTLNYYDAAQMFIRTKYRYLPITNEDAGYENNRQQPENHPMYKGALIINAMKQSIAETISQLDATTFRDLAWSKYKVYTTAPIGYETGTIYEDVYVDAPAGSAKDYEIIKLPISREINTYAGLIHYQTIMQALSAMVFQFNRLKSYEGELAMMNWEREVPRLNELFGLLAKKSFLTKVDNFGQSIMGEYVDMDWVRQNNILSNLVSRHSESVSDPLMEIRSLQIPTEDTKFYAYFGEVEQDGKTLPYYVKVYDYLEDMASVVDGQTVGFTNIMERWADLTSVVETLKWSRSSQTSANERFDAINNIISGLTNGPLNRMKTCFTDLRTVLDKLAPIGAVSWAKGYRPVVTEQSNIKVTDYQLVDDIYTQVLSGRDDLAYMSSEKRWSGSSIWRASTGIPLYDAKSGGMFISVSAKNLTYTGDADGNIGWVPVMFEKMGRIQNGQTYYCEAINRYGKSIYLTYITRGAGLDISLSRLAILNSQNGITMRIPQVVTHSGDFTSVQQSCASYFMGKLFACYVVPGQVTTITALSPDCIALYDFQIPDPLNSVLAYAKQYGPYRGTGDSETTLGFSLISKA